MKKQLLILSAIIAFGLTTKAQIINASADDFETWSTDIANPSAMEPCASQTSPGWQTLNILSSAFTGSSPVSVFEENTIIHSGSHSAKIVSVVLSGTSYGYVKGLVPDTVGVILAGSLITSPSPSFKPGVPYATRISALNFYYQYFPATASKPDTGYVLVSLTHKGNTLGGGLLKLLSTGSTWTMGTVPIVYDSLTGNPDTINVVFSASNIYSKAIPVPGSILYVDGASVTGVNEVNASTANVEVYPNPASSNVNFRVSTTNGDQGYSITVFDVTGKKMDTYPVRNNMASINTASYAAGLYFYQLYDKNGSQMKVGKFDIGR